jgi:hypothetical protein
MKNNTPKKGSNSSEGLGSKIAVQTVIVTQQDDEAQQKPS